MAKSIVVYGPASGRSTSHGAAIAAARGLHHVIALEDVKLLGERLQREGFLYLSCSRDYADRAVRLLGTDLVHIDQALASIGAGHREVTRG